MEHEEDLKKLQQIAMQHGRMISLFAAERIWSTHSYSYAAGWLILDSYDDGELWDILNDGLKE